MSNNLTHTGIKTAGIFGMENAFGFNPGKGCKNEECHLHPVNTGECWSAKMCNRMAGPWAGYEMEYKENQMLGIIDNAKWNFGYEFYKRKLKDFEPTWLDSQFQKQFPKKRSCILVCYMTDIAYIPQIWVQKIIDKINANNQEREKAGLLLHIFQFLTKDPSVYAKFKWPLNCWLGFTATNQAEYNKRLQYLWKYKMKDLKTPDNRVFYAYLEPLRDKVDLLGAKETGAYGWLNWIIVGGGSTPLHPDWARSIKEQCIKLGIRFYFKSWGKWLSYWCPHDHVYKHTKAPKGILFNVFLGRTWEQFPEA